MISAKLFVGLYIERQNVTPTIVSTILEGKSF